MATQNANLDAWFADFSTGAGNGNGKKMSVGLGTGSYDFINRSALQFPRGNLFDPFPTADSITEFDLVVHVVSGNAGIGSAVKLWAKRGTTSFTEVNVVAGQNGVPSGGDISTYVITAGAASGHFPGPSVDASTEAGYEGSPSAGDWIHIHSLALGQWWWAHPEVANLVVVLVAKDETQTNQRVTLNTRESGSAPYIEIAGSSNTPPNKPAPVNVTPGADGQSFTVSAPYFDADGDTSTQFEVVFTPDPGQ
jgi:hypothetical protein